MGHLNTYDPTKADTFSLSLSATAGSDSTIQDSTTAELKQGLWEVVFTCSNVTTAGSLTNIAQIFTFDPFWYHTAGIGWNDQSGTIQFGRFWSDDTVTEVDRGTFISGMTWHTPLRVGLPPTLTLRSYYSQFRDGFTVGVAGTWLNG